MGRSICLNICVLFVFSVLWNHAISDDKCSIGCKGSPSSPTFLTGHKYNYGVESTVSIYLTTADKQETSIKVLGQVSVTSVGNCVLEFSVQNLVISGPDGKKYGSPNGIEKPVRFSLQDGRIGSEICSESGDTRRSLNIKRAIISLLQTEQKTSTQVDVFGACPTEASSSQEGGAVLIHRSRDLSHCAYREQGRNDFITSVYNPTSEIKSTEVLQSSLSVESKVNNGVPEKVSATEEYLYKPFSVGENGARAKVHTKLTLTGKGAGAASGNCDEPHTIIFEKPHEGHAAQSNAQTAVAAVKDTAKTLGSEASSKSAGSFAQLVRVLRVTNKNDLITVYNQVKGNNLEKRVFLDGLLRAGTGYSIEASIDIFKKKELSAFEQQLVLLSLGNARHVNDEALKAAASLLDIPHLPKDIYLGVGALAGSYCRDHNCHKTKPPGIVSVSQKLAAKLQNCKAKTKIEEDNIVAVLKGIKNIHHLEDNLVDKIAHCAADNGVKARVRAAAFEAFLADPCTAKLKKTALDIMKNRQLDSEIRIKAYLAVIGCPCGKSANEIKTLLDSEPVHQVGRFISMSLRAIRSSSNPDKEIARQHYGQIRTPNKFNVDDRKYSFYREASFNVDALGLGGNVEETVIYSQDSFLPRSAAYNVTTELFGHNINILEIGGRQGNLDRVIEHFFGPKSFLRTDSPQTIYDNLVNRYQESKKKVEGLRKRRSIKSEIDNFDKHVKADTISYNDELDLDLYLKLFGTDAIFLSLGDDKGIDFDKLIDQALKYISGGFQSLKHFQQEVRAHLLFLDAELAYPTSIGLPLKIDLVGSATGRFEVATNVDLHQIIRSPENAKIDVKLVPSTDVELNCFFVVDADVVATGLKVGSNLHSSTGGHLIFKVLENGRGFDIQFGLPIEKQEILTVSDDMVFITREKGQKEKTTALKLDAENNDYSGCFDQLAGVLGLTVCGEINVPFAVSGPNVQSSISKFASHYPWTGPAKLKVFLEKNDLRGYHIKGVFRDDHKGKQGFELLFDAEGSKNRRTQLTGDLVLTNEEKSVKLSLDSPIKVLYGEIALVNKPREIAGIIKAKMDAQEYYARAGLTVQGNDKRSVYKPLIEYQDSRGKQNIKVDGQLVREANGPAVKYTIEGVKITLPPGNDVIDLSGHYSQNGPSDVDLDVKAKRADQSLSLNAGYKGHDARVEFTNTLNPNINFKLNGHFQNNDEIAHNDIEVIYGENLKTSQNKIIFNQLLKYHKGKAEEFNLITKNKFEIVALPFKVQFDAEIDPKKVDVELKGQYFDKKAEFDLDGRCHIKKPGDYSVKVTADVDDKGIEAFAKRDVVNADKSNFENYISIKNFGRYELSGVVLHRNKQNDINIGAVGHFKISAGNRNDDIKFDVGVIENPNLYSSHGKISGSKGDFVDYLLKITRGPSTSGQLKFILRDTIAANGQFKVTDNEGKGNGVLIVDFKKAQRKFKSDVKFVAKDPIYNADVELFLNFEKDNKDKIHFTTESKLTEKLTDSKNKFEYSGQKTEVNIHRDGEFTSVGKLHGTVEIVLPTDRTLSFKLDRDVSLKDDVYNGHGELILSDAAKRGGEASTFTYKSKLQNTNFEKDTINYEAQMELKLKDGKSLQNAFSFVTKPEGDNSKFDFKTDFKGSLMPAPASLSAFAELPKDQIDGRQTYKLTGSYGNDIGFQFDEVAEIGGIDTKSDKKYLDDITLSVRLPFEKAHDLKFVSNVVFFTPGNNEVTEYTIIESAQINGEVYKVDLNGKVGLTKGNSKIKVIVPHQDPLSLDSSYQINRDGEKRNYNLDLKAQYGKGKSASVTLSEKQDSHECHYRIKANAPQAEKLKKLEVDVIYQHSSPNTRGTTIIVDADGRVYKSESLIVYSKANPLIDLKYTSPATKQPSRIFIKGTTISSDQGKVEVKLDNIREVSLDAVAEGSVHKDNVVIKLVANSEKLGLKNYKFDVSSKDAGSGKHLELHATNDNKNIFSGSTSFISKQEGPKTIIEGSGSVKVKEEQKSANFKYIRTVLTEGNEQGVETFLNWAIGDRSYVAESRVTNLEYKTSYVYCEEKKQCANIEVHSKVNVQTPGVFQHLFNVGFDLRKVGISPEFGLQVKNEVSERKFPQYSLDLHINKEDKKYHLHAYSQPDHGKFPAGVVITLPKRVLALESQVSYPTNKGLPFPVKFELAAYPDKNKPQLRTVARFDVDVVGQDKQYSGVAEFGFFHPKLGKETVIKVRGNVQRPNENTIKIESAASLSSPSLGNDLESKVYFEVQPVYFKFLVQSPSVKVVDVEGSAVMKDNLQQGNLKFSLLQGKPVQFLAIVKEFKYYEFSTSYTDDSERKLSVIGHIDPEKRVDVSADIILPGEKKNIIFGALYIQDNLVKSDYGVSKDNFNYFLGALKNDVNTLEQRIKQHGEKTSNDFKALLKKAEPSFNKVEQAYKDELTALYKEIAADVKDLPRIIGDLEEFFHKIIDEIIKVTEPLATNIKQTFSETSKKIAEMFEKQIEPQLKELYASVASIATHYFNGLIDLVAHFSALVADFFEKHKAELNELTDTLVEIFKDLTRLIVAQLKELRERAGVLFSELTQQIKEMPIVGLLKEKWQELAVPEQMVEKLQQIYGTVRELLPTEEVKNFADVLFNYVVKKLRQDKVDDAKELRAVYEKFAVALTSVVQFIRNQLNEYGVPSIVNINPFTSIFSGPASGAPTFGGSGSSSASFLNELFKGDVVDPLAYIRAYRPRSFNPLDEIPAKLRAVVVNGQHIFSFDGRHLTFPGSCRYILAHDHVDRNFTLAIQLQNGQPKSLILEDKSGTIIELKDNGQVTLNGAAHGYPVMEKDVFAFRKAEGILGLGSNYGLMAFCTTKLEVCYIEVSGFYLGKLRGLLGDGNNEPFDDFRLPNGKIAHSESEFGNAYRLAGSCPQVKTPEHSAHQHHAALPPACEKVFGASSTLRPLSIVLDIAPFRQACIHAVSGDTPKDIHEACDLARGYTALALTGLLPAVLPAVCVQCRDADKPRELGDTYELKLPNKMADIVIVVETTKSNEKNFKDLVVPLISQVIDQLKSKHINDIKVYLVGVTSKFPYPIIYDTDPKLKNAKVKFDDESRYNLFPVIKTQNAKEQEILKQFGQYIDLISIKLGLGNLVEGYEGLADLPLRPGAVKHTINVVGEHCHNRLAIIQFFRAIAYKLIMEQNAGTASLVTITPDLKIGGGKTPEQVVGFNEHGVILLGDKKKNKDAEALRQSLEIDEDDCISFVQDVGGVVFSASNFQGLNPAQQKQFIQTAAGYVTHQISHQNFVQECTCAYVDAFSVRSVCINKERKETARRRK